MSTTRDDAPLEQRLHQLAAFPAPGCWHVTDTHVTHLPHDTHPTYGWHAAQDTDAAHTREHAPGVGAALDTEAELQRLAQRVSELEAALAAIVGGPTDPQRRSTSSDLR